MSPPINRLLIVLLIPGITASYLHGDEQKLLEKAAEVIDLRVLPIYDKNTRIGSRKIEYLGYVSSSKSRSTLQAIVNFHEKQFREMGGKVLVPPITSDRCAFYYFSLSGFIIQMDVTVTSNPSQVNVEIINHGNVNAATIPKPKGSKIVQRQGFPDICCFAVTPTASRPVESIVQETHNILTQAGWSIIQTQAGRSVHDKRNALSQYKKDSILLLVKSEYLARKKYVEVTYRPYLSSLNYPPPPESSEGFLHRKKNIPPDIILQSFTTPLKKNEVIDYYRDGFEKRNWKEFTSNEIDPESRYLLFFEDEYQSRMVIKIGPDGENQIVDVCSRERQSALEDDSTGSGQNLFKRQR